MTDELVEVVITQSERVHYGVSRDLGEPFAEVVGEEEPDLEPELKKLGAELGATVKVEVHSVTHSGLKHFDGGQDITTIKDIVLAFGGLAGVATFLKVWLNRPSQKPKRIEIRTGKDKIVVDSSDDLEAAVKALSKLKKK
jgi:hypothetical protein